MSIDRFPIYRVVVNDRQQGQISVITFLSLEEIDRVGGLAPEVIVGRLIGPSMELAPKNFARNRTFVDFMHGVIRRAAPTVQDLVQGASTMRAGWLNLDDGRSPRKGNRVDPRDRIGRFRVTRGVIDPASYEPNYDHFILSDRGMTAPHPELQQSILAEMRGIKVKAPNPPGAR